MKVGRPYNGYSLSSLNCPLTTFYAMLEDLSQVKPPLLRYVPDTLLVGGATVIDRYNRYVKGEWRDMYDPVRAEMSAHDWSVNPRRAEEELGFRPRDPRQSLSATIEWIQENEFLRSSL